MGIATEDFVPTIPVQANSNMNPTNSMSQDFHQAATGIFRFSNGFERSTMIRRNKLSVGGFESPPPLEEEESNALPAFETSGMLSDMFHFPSGMALTASTELLDQTLPPNYQAHRPAGESKSDFNYQQLPSINAAASTAAMQLFLMNPRSQSSSTSLQGPGRIVNVLRNSKYVKAAQELLEEFCSVGRVQLKKYKFGRNKTNPSSNHGDTTCSSLTKHLRPLSPPDRIEHQRRKVKLLAMLDERRYELYCEHIKMVVDSLDLVMGNGAAVPYTALARKAMSRHFRSLKDSISAQSKRSSELLGEKDGATGISGITKGETPRLRMLEQSLRQQRGLHQMGGSMMEHEPWRPQRGLPEPSVNILRAWHFEHFFHPYPSDADKHMLARHTGLSRDQCPRQINCSDSALYSPGGRSPCTPSDLGRSPKVTMQSMLGLNNVGGLDMALSFYPECANDPMSHYKFVLVIEAFAKHGLHGVSAWLCMAGWQRGMGLGEVGVSAWQRGMGLGEIGVSAWLCMAVCNVGRSQGNPNNIVGRQGIPATFCIIAALIAALLQPVNVNQPPIIEAMPDCCIIYWMDGVNGVKQLREKKREKIAKEKIAEKRGGRRKGEHNIEEDEQRVIRLISALIECWRPETHTFHLPCGECTITLEDVALQLGVQTNGMPVVMSHEFNNVAQLCSLFLGKTPVPPECKGWRVRNFENSRQYSWGSAILAFLYREMCKASLVVNDNNTAEIGGCLLLLQSWAWHRLPFLTPISRTAVDFPLAGRWRHKIEGTGLVHNNIKEFRLKIDIKAKKEFNWRPYMNEEILALIPYDILDEFQYWCAVTPLINFAFVEIQFGDRVLRQFHFHQPIPRSPWDHDLLQILDGRRQSFLTTIVERRQFLRFKKRFGKAEYSLPSGSGSSSQQPEAEMTDVDNSAPQPFDDAYIPEFVQPDASIYSPMFSSTYDFEHMSVQMPPTNEEDGYHTPEQPQRPQRIRRPPQHYLSTTPRHRQ
ncbi:BEL1-like homeodomain protein 2 [Hibiscus syriacus]|uniref:BEL1-like homeodomain protein 2 n=1 Tax=Hibiscus syriacus TaxID=106335 RepID=A0A6A2YMR1_HIBSY|nr:BEL1-like homeodomain protein 2 [Hibiscus syriacus]